MRKNDGIPEGEYCNYDDGYTQYSQYECRYIRFREDSLPICNKYVENDKPVELERNEGIVYTGHKKCSQCLVENK